MVIGDGMIGSRFTKYCLNESVVIFASGVSNSQNLNIDEFNREKKLLLKVIKEHADKTLIYFSSCYTDISIEVPYYQHKHSIEKLIQEKVSKFFIFRLPQVVGFSNNKNTLVNYLISQIINNKSLTLLKNTKRNLIDIDDIFKISEYLIDNKILQNEIINIASPYNFYILDIVKRLEHFLDKRAVFILMDKGDDFNINIDAIGIYVKSLHIAFNEHYFENLLYKYYGGFKGIRK